MNRTSVIATLTASVALGLAASAAWGAPAPRRLALSQFQGPGADHLRSAVIARLPRNLQVVPASQAARADAVLDGQIWTGKVWKVRLVVRNGKTGAAAGTLVWSGGQPRLLIEEVLREAPAKVEARVVALAQQRRRLAAPRKRIATSRRQVLSAASGPDAEPIPAADPDADNEADADDESEAPAVRTAGARTGTNRGPHADAPMVEISVGAGTVGRTLTFADNQGGAPGYSLPVAGTLGGDLVVYPGARMGGWAARVGLAGAWESTVAATTAGQDGDSHATRHRAWTLGARGRLPLARAMVLGGLDLGGQRFEVDLPGATLSPSVNYRFLRPSLAGRVDLDEFALSLSAAYLKVLSGSGLAGGTSFPRATVQGFELGAGLAYTIADELAVDLRLDFRRFAHDMNARPGDPLLVGGAVDDYLTAGVRLSYRVW